MTRNLRMALGALAGLILTGAPALADTVSVIPSKDNTLYESLSGNLSDGAGSYLFAGKTAFYGVRRGLLRFDLSASIPPGSTITSATLRLHVSQVPNLGPYLFELHRVVADWGEGTSVASGPEGMGGSATPGDATWLHRFYNTNLWTQTGGDYVAVTSAAISVSTTGMYTWSSAGLIDDAQTWVDAPQTNFGWILIGDETQSYSARRFDSRQNADPSVRPTLTIGFSPAPPPTFSQPEIRAATNGELVTQLEARLATNSLGPTNVFTRTFEGTIPSPTLRIKPGDVLRITLTNSLPANPDGNGMPTNMNYPHQINTVNLHTHGLHVSPQGHSDNPLLDIFPGEALLYEIAVPTNHVAGTFFYHPHRHGALWAHFSSGMAGALIVAGDIDQVPEVAAAADLVFLFHQIQVNDAGEVPYPTPEDQNTGGLNGIFPVTHTYLTLNGQVNPTLRIRPGEVQRWRFINGNVSFILTLKLDGHALNRLANDGITLPQVETDDQVLLAPGQRSDVLIRAGDAGTYALRTLARGPTPETVLATLIVTGLATNMNLPSTLPAPAVLPDIQTNELTGSRFISFDVQAGTPVPRYMINQQQFDMARIDQSIHLGAVEEWTVINTSGMEHPFHIHVNPFQVVQTNGVPVSPPVWRDTVLLPGFGSVTFRARFQDFKGKTVMHCHMVNHEDLGMMSLIEMFQPATNPLSIGVAADQATLTLDTEVGTNYAIEASEDLASWFELSGLFPATNRPSTISDPVFGIPRRFYRAILP